MTVKYCCPTWSCLFGSSQFCMFFLCFQFQLLSVFTGPGKKKKIRDYVRSVIFMKSVMFWDVMLCGPVEFFHWHFGVSAASIFSVEEWATKKPARTRLQALKMDAVQTMCSSSQKMPQLWEPQIQEIILLFAHMYAK